MFNFDLIRQARRILGRRYAQSGVRWQGQFGFACPQLGIHDFVWNRNRVVNTGLDAILNAFFRGEGVPAALYIAPFGVNVAPPASLTMANFNTTLTEFTNYDEATRQTWTSDAASSAQLLENTAAPALFTVGAGAQTSIYGALLTTNNVKGGTNGTAVAAALAPAPFLNLAQGFEVKIKYRITGASS